MRGRVRKRSTSAFWLGTPPFTSLPGNIAGSLLSTFYTSYLTSSLAVLARSVCPIRETYATFHRTIVSTHGENGYRILLSAEHKQRGRYFGSLLESRTWNTRDRATCGDKTYSRIATAGGAGEASAVGR